MPTRPPFTSHCSNFRSLLSHFPFRFSSAIASCHPCVPQAHDMSNSTSPSCLHILLQSPLWLCCLRILYFFQIDPKKKERHFCFFNFNCSIFVRLVPSHLSVYIFPNMLECVLWTDVFRCVLCEVSWGLLCMCVCVCFRGGFSWCPGIPCCGK
jgi:hypothetical protein